MVGGQLFKNTLSRRHNGHQRISEFLAEFGGEGCFRDFFRAYHYFIKGSADAGENILIDSTGLPDNIHFPLTAVSNHNGEISREVRLIYVTQRETGPAHIFQILPRQCHRRVHPSQDNGRA